MVCISIRNLFHWIYFPSGLSPTTLQALAKLVNARTVNTALLTLVSCCEIFVLVSRVICTLLTEVG